MEAVSRTSGVRQSRWRSCCILIHLQTYVCVDGTRHIRTLLSEFLKNTSQKDSAPDASSLRNTWFRPCSTHKYLAFHIVQDLQHWLSLPILAENKVVHGTLRPICLCVLVLEERERGKNPWWFSYILQLRQKKKKKKSRPLDVMHMRWTAWCHHGSPMLWAPRMIDQVILQMCIVLSTYYLLSIVASRFSTLSKFKSTLCPGTNGVLWGDRH